MNRKIPGLTIAMLISVGCSHTAVDRELASHRGKAPGKTNPPAPSMVQAWVEMGPNGTAIARAILAGNVCPPLVIGSNAVVMQKRASPTVNNSFPGIVCESLIPRGVVVSIAGQTLPIAPVAPTKILVMGDTGCRIKTSARGKAQIQSCNNPSAWPFSKIAQVAAKLRPDLVIHVGDYHYREAACPAGDRRCSGSVYGDNWVSWSEDFFAPARPLLSAAPWVFVRGNHEICTRAQEGYFRFLDPRPLQSACEDVIPPYAVSFNNLSLLVLDSSMGDVTAENMATLNGVSTNGAWLVTHRPPWISDAAKSAGDGDGDEENSAASIAPVGVSQNIGLVITGHQHLFRAVSFADHRPPQIIAGNGGTLLDQHPMANAPGTPVDAGTTVLASVNTFVNFGFMVMQQMGSSSWSADVYDQFGNRAVSCTLTPSNESSATMSMTCAGPN